MSWLNARSKEAIKEMRRRQQAALRCPPRLHVSQSTNRPPQVYYLCPDTNTPTGGVRVIYRHVDILNSIGISSAVVHRKSNFSCSWFQHTTRVMAASEVILSPSDVLVVPEYYGRRLTDLPEGPRVVLFNQNAYQTFSGPYPVNPADPYPGVDRVEAILVVSRDNAEYARYAFPGTRVLRIRNSIDDRVFYPSKEPPRRVLAFMPRKRQADCDQVLSLLGMRDSLKTWDLLRISNLSETQTADALRKSSLFLSFSEKEGFGMPPAEAMASGCYVIGFTGLAGREFFHHDFSMPVEEGNILDFAKGVESMISRFNRDPEGVRRLGLQASANIFAEYSRDEQIGDLENFFRSFVANAA